jgi:hypothetical protein
MEQNQIANIEMSETLISKKPEAKSKQLGSKTQINRDELLGRGITADVFKGQYTMDAD